MIDKLLVSLFSYLNAVFALAFNLFLITTLKKAEYGLWSLINSAAAIIAIFSLLGFPRAYQNFMAREGELDFELYVVATIRAIILALICGAIWLYFSYSSVVGSESDPAKTSMLLLLFLICHFVLLDFGSVAAQMGSMPRKVFVMAAHPNAIRLFVFAVLVLVGSYLFGANVSFEFVVVSVFLQVIVTVVIVFFVIYEGGVKSWSSSIFQVCSRLNQKRVLFFCSNFGAVFSVYVGTLLVGYSGNVNDVADFQLVFLLINFCLILPNAIYVRLLGSRAQEDFNRGSVSVNEVLKTSVLMFLAGAGLSFAGLVGLEFVLPYATPHYSLPSQTGLLAVVFIVSCRFGGAYPFALMNSGDLIVRKTKYQLVSIAILFGTFYLSAFDSLVDRILWAYAFSELYRSGISLYRVSEVVSRKSCA